MKRDRISLRFMPVLLTVVLGFLLFSMIPAGSGFAYTKSELQERLADIKDLHQKLVLKHREVVDLKSKFGDRIEDLKDEISNIRRNENISTYRQAIRVSRIKYNLKLIQRELAYIEKLDQVDRHVIAAREEVIYFQRQTEDKIKMVGLLGEEEVRDLVKNIDRVIKARTSEAEGFSINMEGIHLRSFEDIWGDIVSGRL